MIKLNHVKVNHFTIRRMMRSSVCQSVRATHGAVRSKETRSIAKGFCH